MSDDWEVEEIPNSADLFLRVHRSNIKPDRLTSKAFEARGGGMSVDWSKYATPEQTRNHFANGPHNYGVVGMSAGDVRKNNALDVKHTPIKNDPVFPDNRAHSDVIDSEDLVDAERILHLKRIVRWVICIDDPIPAETP